MVIVLHLTKLHPRMLHANSIEIGPIILEKIFIFRQCILLFCSDLLFEKGVVLHLNKFESPSPNDAFCQVWCLNSSIYFRYYSLEKSVTVHLNTLESPSHKDAFVPSLFKTYPVVLEKKIFNFVNVFSLIRNYLTMEKGMAFHFNTLEFLSPKDALCQVLMK